MTNVRARRGWMTILLLGLVLLALGGVRPAHAQSANCVGNYGTPPGVPPGLLDGNVNPTPPNVPNLLQIDGACTIQNYPAPTGYTGSISWLSTNNTLLIFNNVDFTGNMSCDSHEHGDFIWFERDEKSYVIRDQATIDRAKKFWAPQEELGKKQEALGQQQEALGKQQEELCQTKTFN